MSVFCLVREYRHSQNMKILEGFDGSVWQIPEILQDMKQHLQDITLIEDGNWIFFFAASW